MLTTAHPPRTVPRLLAFALALCAPLLSVALVAGIVVDQWGCLGGVPRCD